MKICARVTSIWVVAVAVMAAGTAASAQQANQNRNEQQAGQQQTGQQQAGQQQAGRDREVRRRQAIGQQQGGQQAGQQQVPEAPVPQYWVADATVFIDSARIAANVMAQESALDVQAPSTLRSQTQFLANSVDRALQDMEGLLNNAVETSPDAVPAIRQVTGQLQAAQAQANQLAQATEGGQLGPTFNTTIQSAAQHLNQAMNSMTAIGNAFNAEQFTQIPFRAGNRGQQAQQGGQSGQAVQAQPQGN